ncbi:uncharacterized protein Z520_01645 [Fonsecaea multimorphosa CBS 102226]|uniref:Uncharacterized protein n=1 Tax=Fonsecaea multimorphosa CBS 102226 TaxID=1442371 RepID=A0A0D2KB00_9EURO|nr:uncharacterized protein Z520_01645 [Fonsecaea multimorphosa CBS 102226]KIY03178.1 hypothetical protein Z520_01645 [Fonsecaea multimorphosa CBS 102226]OAL30421.1 hypothetical protein AYO22_01619 [Fonsecaea multimorphosa]
MGGSKNGPIFISQYSYHLEQMPVAQGMEVPSVRDWTSLSKSGRTRQPKSKMEDHFSDMLTQRTSSDVYEMLGGSILHTNYYNALDFRFFCTPKHLFHYIRAAELIFHISLAARSRRPGEPLHRVSAAKVPSVQTIKQSKRISFLAVQWPHRKVGGLLKIQKFSREEVS